MVWTALSARIKMPESARVSSATPAPMPGARWIGKRAMNRYEIVKFIAEGSNGEVFLAKPNGAGPNQFVVVKRVKESLLANPKFVQFFNGEVLSMKRFDHPNVVRLIDATLHDAEVGPCIVLEYIHGHTLEQILLKYPRWYPERMAKLVGQLCHGLQAAHDAGIMHRDMKPANLMIAGFNTPNETLKIMDFGFAGFTERPHIQIADLTGHGPVFACGTPAYVSPEMLRGDTVDGRADLYGVGVILYEMLTGRLPFDYPTVEEIMEAHIRRPSPAFYKIGIKDVPPTVEALVHLSLAKFPAERHHSAKDMCAHFGQAVGMPNLWSDSAPKGFAPKEPPRTDQFLVDKVAICAPKPGSPEEAYTFFDQFEADMAPKLAAAKLKGFVEDVGGQIVASDPGVIRMRVDLPDGYEEQSTSTRSGLLGWINAIRAVKPERGFEPIEVAMQMQKIDASRVTVFASFQPMKEFMPADHVSWQARCEQLYDTLRAYLMAK
jgi:eukaryotic-like serine/threonine-protein kinase